MKPHISQAASRQIRQILKILRITCLSVISALFVYPLVVILLIPVLIYRSILKFVLQSYDSKYGSILTGMNALLAAPDPYTDPPMELSPYFTFNSKLDRAHVIKVINNQVIKPNVFPELKQKIVRRYGYYFWYEVDNFNVENHVKYLHPDCEGQPVTMKELRHLGATKISGAGFDKTRSPWEIILVPNLFDENNPATKSGVFVRVNHCLMDGYSVAYFVQKLAKEEWSFDGVVKHSNETSIFRNLQKFAVILAAFITGPYHSIKITCFSHDTSAFLKKALTPVENQELWGTLEHEPRKINGENLKKVRKLHNVAVSSLLLTLVIESVSRYIRKKCDQGYAKLPRQIYVQMSVPLPGHPNALTNHWSFVRLPITLTKDSNPKEILTKVHRKYEMYKHSPVPLVNYGMTYLLGLFPIWTFPNIQDLPVQTIILLNFPGPLKKVDMFGYEWESVSLSGFPGNLNAFVAGCQSFRGKFWIDIGGMGTICENQEDLNSLQQNVHDILKELETEETYRKLLIP